MPRWRALPGELDPQVREFVEVLRRVVDRTGLSVAAVADRTGYGRTSWERYLQGRLLAPKGAVVALAEVAGTPPAHLTALWEQAERAWSRSETRPDLAAHAVGALRPRPLPGQFGPPPERPAAAGSRRGTVSGGAGRRRAALFVAATAGAVIVAVGAFLLSGGADPRTVGAAKPPSPTAGTPRVLPSGVGCAGSGCSGRDAEEMGCSNGLAATAKSATVGATLVEVRYSRVCRAAWGRITPAAPGDTVAVSAGSVRRTGRVTAAGDTVAYTPMVAVSGADDARACAVLASGEKGCTP